MNYQHSYHAGNFSEVVKHSVLLLIQDYLQIKASPLCFIDTHAGMGFYDLKSVEAEKTQESVNGIQRLMSLSRHPVILQKYVQIVKDVQVDSEVRFYPGSPEFVYANMRSHDQLILNEYHPVTFQKLKENFCRKPNIAIHHRDAYEFLPAVLPPKEKRGLVIIDPPYENKMESLALVELLQRSLLRWAHGVYLVWFPLTALREHAVAKIVVENNIKKFLIATFSIDKIHAENKGLLGCQLLVVNPPWQLEKQLAELLPYLWDIFSLKKEGGWSVETG